MSYFVLPLIYTLLLRIPCDRSKELAERYGVRDLLAPIFNFQLDSMGVQNGDEAFLTKEQAIVANKKKLSDLTKDRKQYPHYPLGDDSLSARKKHNTNEESMALSNSGMSSQPYQSPSFPPLPNQSTSSSSSTAINTEDNINSTERHRSVLMSIFLSDKPDQIPELLKNNHSSINLDMVIDEQGNTALHWATALARSKTVEFLVGHGANIACINYSGETPLMRGVMVTNNYDNQSFVTVFGLLKESLTLLDNKKRSVLHHCALTAGIQGRTNAAIHYMQVLMKEEETRGLLDTQDSLGDTALTIAIRLDCQALVDILKEAGAKEDTQNHIGLQVADYQQSEVRKTESDVIMKLTSFLIGFPHG
jgi:regulatory protein SWI6